LTSLSSPDLRAVLGYADSTLDVDDLGQVPPVLLGGLTTLVGCEGATLTHLDLRTQREVAVFWPPSRADPRTLDEYAPVAATHPLRGLLTARVRARRVDGPPPRISDLLSRRQWHQSALYQHALRGIDDQMCLPLAIRGSALHAVTLARTGRPFSDRQRDLLFASRRHLARAVARARRDGQVALQIAPTTGWVDAAGAPGLEPARGPAGHHAGRPAGRVHGPDGGQLSPRERQVVGLVAAGMTDAQVARRLGLSTATVSKHLHRVYTRLGVPNRVAAVQHWNDTRRDGSGAG
jgi:DNA-binding CsgD family transcriptional regulator